MSDFNEAGVCSIVRNIISTADLTANTDPTANTDTSTDTVYLAAAVNLLTTDRKSFLCLQTLPDLNTIDVPNGHIAYLCDAKTMIVASNCSWIGLDGRSLGQKIENRLYAWGAGQCGAIGDGLAVNRCSPVQEICRSTNWCIATAGTLSAQGIKSDGTLWGWGCNSAGNLGTGTTLVTFSPVQEYCSATNWCQISDHSCFLNAAIKTDGSLWSWGCNGFGVLGNGTTLISCSPVQEICSSTNWCQVSGGRLVTHAIKSDGSLWGWGCATCGAIGDGSVTSKCSPVQEFCSATNWCMVKSLEQGAIAIKTSGEMWSWGANSCGSLGDGTTFNKCSPIREICSDTNWCLVSTEMTGALAIKTDGSIWGWGRSSCGRIGDGTTLISCSPVREFCSATNWCFASTGFFGSLAIKTDGSLWAWGNGCGFTLGDGTSVSKCSPVRELCSCIDWIYVNISKIHSVSLGITATKVVCR